MLATEQLAACRFPSDASAGATRRGQHPRGTRKLRSSVMLVIGRSGRVHPRTHERAVATLDNGLARLMHEVEQEVDVVHRE